MFVKENNVLNIIINNSVCGMMSKERKKEQNWSPFTPQRQTFFIGKD